jgi:predicted RNA-binding Zn-ribbon protein involved in translation (DUF1610 family)
MNLSFAPIEEMAIRNAVEIASEKGLTIKSQEPCKVCSTPLLSISITSSKGLVDHLSCPSCGERHIRPVLQFKS